MKSIARVSVIVCACLFRAAADTQPDSLPGLAFWVRADTGVTTNATGRVVQWADQSGRANHAAAADAAVPEFVTSEPGLNDQPTLRFNGNSQRMTVASRILTNGIEGCTLIAMAKSTKNENSTIVGIRMGSGIPFMQLDTDNTGKPRFIVRNSASATANSVGSLARNDTYGMYAGRLFKGTGTVWTNRLYFSNALIADGSSSADFGASTDLTSGDQYIGGLSFAFWKGDIAEVMIYERALSEAELVGIEAYLASRHKMSRSAPPAATLDEIPGLKFWLRSDACVYKDLFANDEAGHHAVVRLWSDATTNDHDAVALTTPTLVTNMVNGLPAVGFSNGAADRYYLDTPITADPRQLVVFAVFRQWPGDMVQNMLFTHRNTPTPLVQASFENATNAVLQMRGNAGGNVQKITVPGLLTNGAFNVVMYQFDAVNDRHAVTVNGGAEVVNTYDFGSQTFIADTQRIGCYNYNGTDDLFLHGHLAEILVYEGVALTRKQKNVIGFNLETKYGLDTGYMPSGTMIQVR